MATTNDVEAAYRDREGDVHPDAPLSDTAHLQLDELEEDDSTPTPRFIQDQGSYRHWRWVPPYARRIAKKFLVWGKGPQPPQIQVIVPVFPAIQEAPIRLLDKYVPKNRGRFILLLLFYFCWIFTFGIVLYQSTFATEIAGYGEPGQIFCGATVFPSATGCGINGNRCRPFTDRSFAFKCSADCASYKLLNPRAVGAQEIIYRTLVVGGPPENDTDGVAVYRGDSFICPAAIHAGIISNSDGGCGVVSLIGARQKYDSSRRNGITSVSFDSYFPTSFTFSKGMTCESKDPRWLLLIISLVYTILFSLFTSSPTVFFFTIVTGLFFHVGFASDPPRGPPLADLFSNLIGKYLPVMFCMFVVYKYCAAKTLTNLTAHMEKTVLWLGGAWIGALNNYTFSFIPISRLTGHDLEQQPGAKLSLALVILFLVCVVGQQVYYFRLEGRFFKYLALYVTFIGGILLCLALPGLNLRIHHYILALLLLPGTSMQTRPVLLYQGLLVGLFINGIARWGFDPVLQTSGALQGDGQYYSGLPMMFEPIISLGLAGSQISFSWAIPEWPFDGVSVLVNDVERFRGYVDEGYGGKDGKRFIWDRVAGMAEPEYFRFGYLQGGRPWDYTKAGTWLPDGKWMEMAPGPSKIRRSLIEESDVRV